jgi:class 3 adenylate cyclase/tetratricopeptide (TPR) repeat protein
VLRCPACGESNPDRARFCVACGSPLGAGAAEGSEERKIVTIVFAELVGLRRTTGAVDPEELKAALEPFHVLVARVVASHGGTVDKFMGPVALCVFGAPVAHEDDPERGVRAALRIREGVQELDAASTELDLAVRAGVTTGEAVVAGVARGPQIGEAVTGDVVNTASRLQIAAGRGQILVGEPTYRATGLVLEWQEHEPVVAKGKAEPLPVWSAIGSRGRYGMDLRPRSATPLVGRRSELSRLETAFRRVVEEPAVHLVTIFGEAGVGKTRLIQALNDVAEEWPGLIRWRQGRSLPYGEGLSFWALTEIVKADAGILESDLPKEAERKLSDSLEPYLADRGEREWVHGGLAPLAGAPRGALETPREEQFAIWRRWFEALAADSPFVVVFEDLQWADDGMLDFVEHLVDRSVGLPLLVVGAARPELLERRPAWGRDGRNQTTIALSPLADQETAMLIGALLGGAVLPPETQSALIERCGGNPLYVEEFVRMLRDQGSLRAGAVLPGEMPMPQTVQLLIGSRIDTLPPIEREILRDAAVVGKVFWSGSVEAVAGLPEDVVVRALDESVRREFVRRSPEPSFQGQQEFAFNHRIVQEVAYGQIPRAARADKHIATARWMRAIAGSRVPEIAELLAHHYGQGLAYRRAARPDADVDDLARAAGGALMVAGDRAKRLDAARAVDLFRRARAVLPSGDADRTLALLEAAEAAEQAGRLDEAERDFDAAIVELRAGDDPEALGEALARGAQSVLRYGTSARALLEEAVSILEALPAGSELVRAYARMAGHLYVSGDAAAAIPWADKALELADELGLDDEAVLALQYRGASRSQTGDGGGLEDLREALRRGLELGLGQEVATTYNNLAYELWFWEGPAAAQAMWDEMTEFCRGRGFATLGMWAQAGMLESLFDLGQWERVDALTAEILEWERTHGPSRVGIPALEYRAWVRVRRGRWDEAAELVERALPRARDIGYPEFAAPVAVIAAEVALAAWEPDRVRAALDEFVRVTDEAADYRVALLPVVARILWAVDDVSEAAALVRSAPEPRAKRLRLSLEAARAVVAEARGELEEAARIYAACAPSWREYGFGLEEAWLRLGLGRCLLGLGRDDEARPELDRALELAGELGAEPILRAVEAAGAVTDSAP